MPWYEKTTYVLAELQAKNLPVADCELIGLVLKAKEGCEVTPEVQADIDEIKKNVNEYLTKFLPPGICPGCDSKLGGMLGTFMWGLAHGEGYCSSCNYPCRGSHDLPDIAFAMLLPYHPSVLEQADGSPDKAG